LRPESLARVVRQSLWRSRGTLGLAAVGVAVGIASLAFFLALSSGMRGAMQRIFPVEQIEVVQSVGGDAGALGLLGGAPPALTDEDVARVRAVPGVSRAFPRMSLAFPTKAWGGDNLLNARRYSELIGDGVSADLVDDLPRGATFGDMSARSSRRACTADRGCPNGEYCDTGSGDGRCERIIPVLVSPYLVELYNDFVAPGRNLPLANRWLLERARGLSFNVRLGESYAGRADCGGREPCEPRDVRMRLAGVSRHAVTLGVTIPIEYVRRWNREYAGDESATRYSRIVVEVKRQGYDVPSTRAQQAGLTVTVITALLALTSVLIILVAAINIAHTFYSLVHERGQEIGLYRALGATRGDVRTMLLVEAAAVGFVAGCVGLALSLGAAWLCDLAWERWVPDFPFKPDTLFQYDATLVAVAMVFAVACCLLGAALPAQRAARLDPARALS